MKTIYKQLLLLIFFPSIVLGQDTLKLAQLEKISYAFEIENNKLIGMGGDFLKEELSKAQYTMIGEYHGSKRISEFTNAIIPILNGIGYKAMALEVGPVTGQYLNSLETNIENNIKTIHEKYLTRDADGYVNTPFPFFDYKEDIAFLNTAKSNSWKIFGIDQEFYDGFIMLADKMYANLDATSKERYRILHKNSISELKQFYLDDQTDKKNLHVALSESKLYNAFLEAMSNEPKNLEIIEALRKSSEIYMLYNNRKWYTNNATRIRYMKSLLRRSLENSKFNLNEDKLLLKMGGYHLSKGFSPLSLYEIGNTINELAEYHGNTALNIGFLSRYSIDNGELVDNYYSTNRYYSNMKELLQIGKKDKWVVIDLRKLIKGHFYYPKKYNLNKQIEELVTRYDLLIIPETEVEGQTIYD